MALPTTISGPSWPNSGSGNLGPFLYSGNVYIVSVDGSLDPDVYKATDPTSSFTAQDSANNPPANTEYLDCYFDGTYIHVLIVTTAGNTEYARFDCSSDTWVDAATYGGSSGFESRVIYTPTDAPTTYWGGITVRSDGDIIMVHPGENPSSMGGTYQEVYYSRIEGTSLTAGVTVASTAGKNDNYLYAYVVMGSSDQCHFAYTRDTDSDFYLRALDSSNNLRTQRSLATSIDYVTHGTTYTRSSTEKIAFVGTLSGNIYKIYFTHFTDDSSPSFTSETVTSSGSTTLSFKSIGLRPDTLATNVDNYFGYIQTVNEDVWLQGDDGGTTWSDQNSSTAIRTGTIYGVSGNIYTRGGNRVYAFLYDSVGTGTVNYDEFTLYAVATATSKPFRRRAVRFAPMRF